MSKKIIPAQRIKHIAEFIRFLQPEREMYIQTHNYPDHDAVAAAFGLQHLLALHQIKSHILYVGDIGEGSLLHMIEKLNITISHADDYSAMQPQDKIVIVDGCKGSKNVLDLVGDEVAVIDHHEINPDDIEDVEFVDIRPWLGSCSSLIASYYNELDIAIPPNVATAFQIGITMDTSNLTRAVDRLDLRFFTDFYFTSNRDFVDSILRNYLALDDLSYYRYLIDHLKIKAEVAFCFFPDGCRPNMLGILSDFVLALKEIDLVVLCALNGDKVYFSLRNENRKWNASLIVRHLLQGIGNGGGHSHMAGGIIFRSADFNSERIYDALLQLIGK